MTFVSHASNGEDVLVRRACRGVARGVWIDIGAGDGTRGSVTRGLSAEGWTGVNVEADPARFARLAAARPGETNLAVAVASLPGTAPLHVFEDGTGATLSATLAEAERLRGRTPTLVPVETTTLAAICRRHAPAAIHLLRIAARGVEDEVLEGGDFDRHRPWIVLVRSGTPDAADGTPAWERRLCGAGYRFVWADGANRFFLADEQAALARHFTLPPHDGDRYRTAGSIAQDEALREMSQALVKARRHEAGLAAARTALETALAARDAALRAEASARAEAAWLRDGVGQGRERIRALDAALREAERRAETLPPPAPAPVEPPPDPVAGPVPGPPTEPPSDAVDPAPVPRPASIGRRLLGHVVRPAWRAVRPVARPLGWRTRGFLTLELRQDLDRVRDALDRLAERNAPAPETPPPDHPGATAAPDESGPVSRPAPPETGPDATPEILPPRRPSPHEPRPKHRAVHQFHPGSATGDAITAGMLTLRTLLRGLGFESEIFVENRHPAYADDLFLLDDLPIHDDCVLIVHHSLGCERTDDVASRPAAKLLVYHNITPPELIDHDPDLARLAVLGRAQLAVWRARSEAAIAQSDYTAVELRAARFSTVFTAQTLFDPARLRARAAPDLATPDPIAFDGFTFLFVGRLLRSKGQADLVDAYAAFRTLANAPPSRLVLVGRAFGTDDYVAEVHRRIARHDVGAHVLVTGPVEQDVLEAWFRRADAYVSMSRHEGFGVPLAEAMANGVPIAALDAGAVPFTLGGAGLLVRDTAPDAMASAMHRLATDPALAAELVARGHARLDRFGLDRQAPVIARALAACGAVHVPLPEREPLRRAMRITVAGHTNGSYSLAAINRQVALDLEACLPGQVRLLPVEGAPGAALAGLSQADWPRLEALAAREAAWAGPTVVISQHYPVWVPSPRPDLALAFFWWEEGAVPPETIAQLDASFDAVLVATRPVADALLASGLRRPVRIVGHAPSLDRMFAIGNARVPAIEGARTTFLHVSSAFPRKGVDVLLEAFAVAFGAGENVRLVLKTFPNPHNDVAARLAELRARRPDMPEIVHVDADLDPDAMDALYADADVMVLPSRGEGFNLPAAEAIAAGLALIASEVGGHRHFVSSDTALLVTGTHAPSRSHLASGGSLWFEPDPSSLVDALRVAVDDRPRMARMAASARASLGRALDPAVHAEALADTVADLLARQGPVALPRRFACVTSWAVRCGVADYSRHLLEAMPGDMPRAVVLADTREGETPTTDRVVLPCWTNGTTFDPDPLARTIAREDPEVLSIQHQPGLIPWAGLARLLGDPRVHRRVVLLTLHNTREIDALEPAARASLVASLGPDRVTRLVVHTADDLDRLRGLGLAHVSVIPQGAMAPPIGDVPVPRPLPPEETPVIGAYGFLLAPKNFGAVIEALLILRRTWPTMRLRMVTALHDDRRSEFEHHRLLEFADRIGVGGEVDWHTGFWPHRISMELMRGCDLLVLPYRPSLEASSAALRTALASLVPIAVTPIGTFAEADTATERLAGDTPEAIAEGVAVLLKDRARRAALAEAQAAWMAERAWPLVAQRFAGLAIHLLGERIAARRS